jgi:phage shock protein PspC (stress-responsive transcriptional regulator)
MKKIININFHSRVIPIEETAYDILRKYVESLKKHFAGEEGGDEIVNDIENRFAELFSDRLKKGATCITDTDVEEIIASMGRPEDFDQDENIGANGNSGSTASSFTEEAAAEPRGRLYRSENDKMLGGVCGGLAAYLKIDPSVMRIIYAVLILGSFGTALLLYIILWVVLPPKSMVTSIKKRLFRDPDHRVIGGVASGLASYFNIEVWIPRLIFSLPLIAGFLTSIFRHRWFDFEGPVIFTGGFGGTLFVTYIILWIVLPEARTASEKLEMRGEKIDIGSIKNTIKSDLEGFKQKATVVGAEMKQKAEQFGNEMKYKSGNLKKDISSVNTSRPGIGHAIGVLFRAFFLFISVIVTFALVMALIGVTFTGAGILPLKNYFISGFWQNILAWSAIILFLVLPVIGLLTFLIRRIIGVRRGSNYLGYIFGSLWVIGLISLITLAATVSSHFRTRNFVSEEINLNAPPNGKLIVKMDDSKPVYFDSDWMGIDWDHHAPFFEINDDSLTLNTVRVNVIKSNDSAWHLHREKLSRGYSSAEAHELASQIDFPVEQKDSMLIFARGFSIKPNQQFRNQQVLMVIEMPVGRKILLQKNLENYHWFTMHSKNWRNSGVNFEWDEEDDNASSWDADVEYVMTENGLERTGKNSRQYNSDENNNGEERGNTGPDSSQKKKDNPNGEYRYRKPKTARIPVHAPRTGNAAEKSDPESSAARALLTNLS